MLSAAEVAVADSGQARDGQRVAPGMADLERLYADHAEAVYRHAYHLLGHAEDAHDARQETFLRAHSGLARFRGDSSTRTWLLTICTNVCRNWVRSQLSRREVAYDPRHADLYAAAGDDPLAAAERNEMAALLRRALDELSVSQREIVVLRDIEEMDFDAIASILGCARVSVPVKLFRARRKLKELMSRLLAEKPSGSEGMGS